MVLARELAERMVARGSGHLVFMSSLSGKVGTPRSPVYSATKFGLRGLAQSLREDLRPSGVGVSAIFPGFVRDAGMFHDTGTKLPPRRRARCRRRTSPRRSCARSSATAARSTSRR